MADEHKDSENGYGFEDALNSAADIGKQNRAAAQALFDSLTPPTNLFLAGFHSAKPVDGDQLFEPFQNTHIEPGVGMFSAFLVRVPLRDMLIGNIIMCFHGSPTDPFEKFEVVGVAQVVEILPLQCVFYATTDSLPLYFSKTFLLTRYHACLRLQRHRARHNSESCCR